VSSASDLIRNADTSDGNATLEQTRTNAAAIEGALRDVNRVLTDLLVFSKDLRVNLYRHPLATIVDEAVAAAHPLAAEKGIALRHTGATCVDISVDKLKLVQALGNVIGNAIDMSRAGSEIVVDTRVRDHRAEISITDQGPGVPAPDREAIFTPFFTTKEHGTGLGLAIAREFTEAHGGRLWVEDNPGRRGARFVFEIPAQPASNAPP
jgi:signal transduction histidine kinase